MKYIISASILIFSQIGYSFQQKSYSVGLSYFSQNVYNEIGQGQTGETKFLGEASYPLSLKYDFAAFGNWFIAPQLTHTFVPRESAGGSTEITLTHLSFLTGKNFESYGSAWDWYFGPGILQQKIKGEGGTVQLLNGSTPTTFAQPGRTVTTKNVTMNFGSSYKLYKMRLGLDLVFENFFNNEKRTQSLMFSLAYVFGNGLGSSAGPRVK